MRKGLMYSLCIHGVLLSLLAMRGCAGTGANMKLGGPEQKTAEQEKGTLEAQQEIQVDIIPPPKLGTADNKTDEDGTGKPAHVEDACESFYGGVGVEIEYKSVRGVSYGVIEKVYLDYPAFKNGFQAGDVISHPDRLRGTPGTTVNVQIFRNGQELNYTIVRDKICTTPPKNKKESP